MPARSIENANVRTFRLRAHVTAEEIKDSESNNRGSINALRVKSG